MSTRKGYFHLKRETDFIGNYFNWSGRQDLNLLPLVLRHSIIEALFNALHAVLIGGGSVQVLFFGVEFDELNGFSIFSRCEFHADTLAQTV